MRTIKAVPGEVIHLFVDDGSLALALLAWCGVIGLASALFPLASGAYGVALFLGCALILLGNVVITARPDTRHLSRR